MVDHFNMDKRLLATNSAPILYEGALASFFHLALGFSPRLFLRFAGIYHFSMIINEGRIQRMGEAKFIFIVWTWITLIKMIKMIFKEISDNKFLISEKVNAILFWTRITLKKMNKMK